MPQGLLPFKYEVEKREGGLTALGGVGLYLDLFRALTRISHKPDIFVGADALGTKILCDFGLRMTKSSDLNIFGVINRPIIILTFI